ncbi:hypothetical protein LTR70_002484 [Exophiala xenobiotica]|uniref:NF-X1-type domain-containing protein n=1 Tax=Lithohypha guttulata TaxID=1690604 RepID=A0ABR0KJT3_9EURO|nr:hypothetical protein LTR24_001702 [Lithohypha guttulata]KAK5325319.1 hypothetical protein LTR70_002484 [Exophiala xenobiotica]
MIGTHPHNLRPIVAARKGIIVPSHPNVLREEPRPKVCSFDDDGPGEKSAFGPRHDNDHVYIPDISILPTIDECLSTIRLPWMPKRNVLANHFMEHGYSRHIDTHFRLLRHDSVEKIRDINYRAAQEAFLRHASVSEAYLESYAGHRFFLYPNVRVEAVVPDEYDGLNLQLSYDCPKSLRGRQMYKSTRLEKGMMCSVLQLDHDTNELCIYYFNIQHRLSTHALGSRSGHGSRAAVELSLLPHISDQDQWDIMSIVTGIRPNTTMALIEYPRLLYAGFGNALHCLRQMSDFAYSFGQYISPRQEDYKQNHEQKLQVQPPSYSRRPDYTFDLQPLTGRPESQFSLHDLAGPRLKESLQHLAEYTSLDRGQAIALLSSLNREIAFTQGPPGCGKTFLSVALARVLLASRPADRKLPILLVCHTNHALDAFMTGLRDAGVDKLMRVGGASKEEWTRAINLRGLARDEKYTRGERGDRRTVDVEKDSNFAHLEAWCKGLSGEVLTGFPCWQHVSPIMEGEYPHIYSQLFTAASEPQIQAFTYDYWAKGGDLSTIESLQNELLKRLHANIDGKDDSGRALAKAQALLTDIADFTKTQTSAAGKNDVWRLPLEQRRELLVEWQSKIDNFQGEEAKVIILTTVRSGHELGFLKIPNRINVMCSRAKHGFYVIGNAKALEAHHVWRSIVDIFVTKHAISDSIRLQCDRHPEHYTFASSAEDFTNFGPCKISCDQELDCGHLCTEPCHDPSLHKIIPCKNPCSRRLQCGHKCYKLCGDVMPCDHFEGYLTLSCGRHAVGHTCGEKAKSLQCDAICGEALPCGHTCFGKCAVCDITQQHAFCQAVCAKNMKCGHQCMAICHDTTDCPPCKQICPPSCSHAATMRQCDEAPVPCLELILAHGPYGWVQKTACCLTLSQPLTTQPQLLPPARIDAVVQPALRLFDKKLDSLVRKVQYRGQVLENTSSMFLYHQVVLNKALAASKNIERILGRGDEILEIQKQALALRRVLTQFELGIRAVETAYSREMPTVPDSIWAKFDAVSLGATLARARDAKMTAFFLLQNQDQSQQMSRAACELALFAKALLDPLLEDVDAAKVRPVIADTFVKCRDLLSDVELMLTN